MLMEALGSNERGDPIIRTEGILNNTCAIIVYENLVGVCSND
jgi:hypothetical protein